MTGIRVFLIRFLWKLTSLLLSFLFNLFPPKLSLPLFLLYPLFLSPFPLYLLLLFPFSLFYPQSLLILPPLLFPQSTRLSISILLPLRDSRLLYQSSTAIRRMNHRNDSGILKQLQLSVLRVFLCHDLEES